MQCDTRGSFTGKTKTMGSSLGTSISVDIKALRFLNLYSSIRVLASILTERD